MESTECTAQTWGSYPEIQNIEYKYTGRDGKYRVYCANGSYTEIQNIEYKYTG